MTETAYLGALVQYQVEVGEGRYLRVAEMNPKVIQEGQVILRAEESDVVLLDK